MVVNIVNAFNNILVLVLVLVFGFTVFDVSACYLSRVGWIQAITGYRTNLSMTQYGPLLYVGPFSSCVSEFSSIIGMLPIASTPSP